MLSLTPVEWVVLQVVHSTFRRPAVIYLIGALALLWLVRWILVRMATALVHTLTPEEYDGVDGDDDDEEETAENDEDDEEDGSRIGRRSERLHRLRGRPSATASALSGPTLWNPELLEYTLRRFIQPPSTPGNSGTSPWGTWNQGDRYKTEIVCRELLEHMLQMPLPKVQPAWLVNPTTKRRLGLDMYNEAHRIAFEYDGAQHDVFTPHYHTNEHHFEYRRLLDRLKQNCVVSTELC